MIRIKQWVKTNIYLYRRKRGYLYVFCIFLFSLAFVTYLNICRSVGGVYFLCYMPPLYDGILKDPNDINPCSDCCQATIRGNFYFWPIANDNSFLITLIYCLSMWTNILPRLNNTETFGKETSIQMIWAATWQNQQSECAPSEDSDQPRHPPSLIRVFAVRVQKAWVLRYPWSAQRRLWSGWADGRMLRLIWVFAGRTLTVLVLSCRGSYQSSLFRPCKVDETISHLWCVWLILFFIYSSVMERGYQNCAYTEKTIHREQAFANKRLSHVILGVTCYSKAVLSGWTIPINTAYRLILGFNTKFLTMDTGLVTYSETGFSHDTAHF